jgi:hypothetical protein
MTLIPTVPKVFTEPASFTFVNGITTQLSAVGGVRVEYAILFVSLPVATQVPFPNIILTPTTEKLLPDVGIPTHDSAVGGFAREYAMLFVPLPTATHAPFP